jgi:hypothetical protein
MAGAQHLLMSVTAQKQDITDPEVIHRFAGEVADRQRLDYLYLLTCADIAGTSPKLWNDWKDRLLADLHTATRLALRRGLEHPVAAEQRIEENRAAARALLSASGDDDARWNRCSHACRARTSCAAGRTRSPGRPAIRCTPRRATVRWSACAIATEAASDWKSSCIARPRRPVRRAS